MSVPHCSQPGFYRGHLFREHEKRTKAVVGLTLVMMFVEIIGGEWLSSMALLADGFHMATHVGALGISAFAYAYARRHAHNPRYSFGTGKVNDLAGFTSAIILGLIAVFVVFQSSMRLITPVPIVYGEAILIALLGLATNVASAVILHGGKGDPSDHHHGHDHHVHDNNFRSAYVHVIADAVTSILAIVALAGGWIFGWRWMDPAMGIVGACVILSWAWSLLRDTSAILLDQAPAGDMAEKVRHILNQHAAEVKDLHVWRVGQGAHALILAVKAEPSVTSDNVRNWLKAMNFAHMTVEVSQAP